MGKRQSVRAWESFQPIGSLRAPTHETAAQPLGSRARSVTHISWRMHALSTLFNISMTFQRLNDIIKKRIMTLIIYGKNLRSFYYKLSRIWKIVKRILISALLMHVNAMINS